MKQQHHVTIDWTLIDVMHTNPLPVHVVRFVGILIPAGKAFFGRSVDCDHVLIHPSLTHQMYTVIHHKAYRTLSVDPLRPRLEDEYSSVQPIGTKQSWHTKLSYRFS